MTVIELRRLSTLILASLLSWPFVACEAVAPNRESLGNAKQRAISDQLHNSGTQGLVFLPPMVPPPANQGDFLPNLPVTVRIDELTANGVTLRTLATFTSTSGPEHEWLRIHYLNSPCDADDNDGDTDPSGYYYARWFTNDAHLNPRARYRVRVLVPARAGLTRELGYADVDVVTTAREFRTVDTQDFTPLINGQTLRIKFRVDRPAVDRDRDGVFDWQDNCPSVANPDQVDSLTNGIGDACRCAHVTCPPQDACHAPGTCQPQTGTCSQPSAPDGKPCSLAHGQAACSQGVCQLLQCAPHYADCNSNSADGCEAAIDKADNCGGCAVTCIEGPNSRAVCRQGQCTLSCNRGHADCDADPTTGCETEINTEPTNCGSCGHACSNQEGCVHGGCTSAICQDSFADCDKKAINGCEVNIGEDVNNCGTCGKRCTLPNATAQCSSGMCAVASCNGGFADCNGVPDDGCETDLNLDLGNCGACGSACALPGAVSVCTGGTCAMVACQLGHADCNGLPQDGCEIALGSDAANCGACGSACNVNVANQCVGGHCAVGNCLTGFGDCNGQVQDGCEAKVASDPANCGGCGQACPSAPNAQPICISGACAIGCTTGYADCDNEPTNGCEVNLQNNCGACACNIAHALSECVNGACAFSLCQPGFADCDGVAANGCEVDLNSEVTDCGTCGNSCALPNRVSACVDGTCSAGDCQPDYADCDGDPANGCEANLTQDINHCGSCKACPAGARFCFYGGCLCSNTMPPCENNTCPDFKNDPQHCGRCDSPCGFAETCSNGQCLCPSGKYCGSSSMPRCCWYPDDSCGTGQCFSKHPDHCGMNGGVQCAPGEICGQELPLGHFDYKCLVPNTDTDRNNCGSIGNACAVDQYCAGGLCVVGEDPNNCAYVGNVCGAGKICSSRTCIFDPNNCGGPGIQCPAGAICGGSTCLCGPPIYAFSPCDGVCYDWLSDSNHCGGCGNVCPSGSICSGGVCTVSG